MPLAHLCRGRVILSEDLPAPRSDRSPSAAAINHSQSAGRCWGVTQLYAINGPVGAQISGTEGVVTHHKFKIGQTVNYTSGPFGRSVTSNIYKVTQLLPPEGDDFQYRIRSASEPHERVVKESQLERA